MDNNTTSDFTELVRRIEKKIILLPDFQREFVWKDEEQQKKIVASVLAKMPIGSILLLDSKPDEYSSKTIGCKKGVDIKDIKGNVEFLLDGQQRITVLTNVFSNVIHDNCENISDLISPSLKRRFFLRIPKWRSIINNEEKDLFGVKNLEFKIQNPDNEDPEFLASDILPFVECFSFLKDDKKVYNPSTKLSTDLDDFCLTFEDGYLIPLYLLIPSEDANKKQSLLRYKKIIESIPCKIGDEIKDYYATLTQDIDREKFLREMCNDLVDVTTEEEFHSEIDDKVSIWGDYLKSFLDSCVKQMLLNRIIVAEDQRARAIDIYENLNRGGISLNTFDLIMARVAKVSNENFYARLINYIKTFWGYKKKVLSDTIEPLISNKIDSNQYNAAQETGCYNNDKNEISSKYIDAFLDVLSIYCNNKELKPDNVKLDYIKRNKILALEPNEINDNCKLVCKAIDRALFFFQTRCGIRNIKEINYQLMLVLVATIFIKDEFFEDKKVHKVLEAWYWMSLFGGEYDKDQNTMMISHLQLLLKSLETKNYEWIIKATDEYVLERQNFSDEKILLYEKVDEDRYPKTVFRNFVCQYLLAQTYADMFDDNNTVSVFSKDAKSLEAHHIIPLGSITKMGQLSSELRNNVKSPYNSPLNFVYITKEANNAISDKSVKQYIDNITVEARSTIFNSMDLDSYFDDVYIKKFLKERYNWLKGNVKAHIKKLLA